MEAPQPMSTQTHFTDPPYPATFSIITYLNPDDEISPSLHNRIVFYKSLIPFGCKPDDGRIRPKHVALYFHPL